MKLAFTAGQFVVETWTDSYPNWMTVKYRGQAMPERFHHNELRDLIYVLQRMQTAGRAAMPDPYKHEYD